MDVSAVNAAVTTYSSSRTTQSDKKTSDTTKKDNDTAVVYEPSKNNKEEKTTSTKKTYTKNTELVNQLKADAEARASQLQSLVEKMFQKQGQTLASTDDMWKFLAGGNFTVDAATKAQAQKDIADDGYWGVNQTSERILSFAKALTGGDPEKIETMKKAFQKGFDDATKAWGKKLPDISQKTYDAVMKGFDDWKNENTTSSTEAEA